MSDQAAGAPCYTLNPDGTTSAARQCVDPDCTYPNPHTHPDLIDRRDSAPKESGQ